MGDEEKHRAQGLLPSVAVMQVMQAEEWNDEVPLRGILQVVQVMQVV